MGTSRTRQGTFRDRERKAWGHPGTRQGTFRNGDRKVWGHPRLGKGLSETEKEGAWGRLGTWLAAREHQGHGERDKDTQGDGEQDRAKTLRYPGAQGKGRDPESRSWGMRRQSEAQRMGHGGARQHKAGDNQAPGKAPVTMSRDPKVQNRGHGELGTTGHGSARHRDLGQGIPRAWDGGHGSAGRGTRVDSGAQSRERRNSKETRGGRH